MAQVCFTLQVDPTRLEEYRAAHAAVWPEMLRALADTGWRDYHLHLRDDGLLVGVVETDDFAGIQQAMAATDVNPRWQAAMAGFFTDLGDDRPDEAMRPLDEVFHLETQIQRLAKDPA